MRDSAFRVTRSPCSSPSDSREPSRGRYGNAACTVRKAGTLEPMLFVLLRSVAGIALRWFYSRIDVEGLEKIPPTAPVLLAVNHPNALVDALVVAWISPRRMVLTARA